MFLFFRPLKQTTSWERQKSNGGNVPIIDSEIPNQNHNNGGENVECIEGGNWSSDCSGSEDEEHPNTANPVSIFNDFPHRFLHMFCKYSVYCLTKKTNGVTGC